MLYLPNIFTIDGTNICMTDTGAKTWGGELAASGWRTIPTNMKNVSVHPLCAMGEVGLLWGGGKGIPEVYGRGVQQDLIPDVGQLVTPWFPVE